MVLQLARPHLRHVDTIAFCDDVDEKGILEEDFWQFPFFPLEN